MPLNENISDKKKVPIERIFRETFGREMTPEERQILLGETKKDRKAKSANSN
jgi:hypothetical protein